MQLQQTDLFFGTSGPRDAKIAVVGESWGAEEDNAKSPLVGQSGQEFDRILLEAGILRHQTFCTNVVAIRPPRNELERLFLPYNKTAPSWRGLNPSEAVLSEISRMHRQLEAVKPDIIIAAGNYALWALTSDGGIDSKSLGEGTTVRVPTGITSWRGSMLISEDPTLPSHLRGRRVLPIIHPAAILRAWYHRAVTVHDLKTKVQLALRGDWRPDPAPVICVPKDVEQCLFFLNDWMRIADERFEKYGTKLRLTNDIETMQKTFITCMGFGHGPFSSSGFALVVPFIRVEDDGTFSSWWSPENEAAIVAACRRILTHPNILLEGQNYIYDTQYIQRWFRVTPRCDFDTMLAQHLLFPGVPKGLDYLSSVYCHYHRYWKDDGKDWDARGNQHRQLLYNGEDCLRTYECGTALRELIVSMGMQDLWAFCKRKTDLALRMTNRGLRVDRQRRSEMAFNLMVELQKVHSRLANIIPQEMARRGKTSKKNWWESEHQQRDLFYEVLGLPAQRNRKTKRPSIDDEALNALLEKHPELGTIFELLKAERSINVIHSNAVSAELDPDGRMRCFVNPGGAETFRWSTSKNAFGRGANLQNLTKGDEE